LNASNPQRLAQGVDTSKLNSIATTVTTAATAFASPSTLAKNAGTLDGLAQTATKTASGLLSSSASSIASGLSNLPGGAGAVSSVTNLAKGALPSLPGTDTLKDAISGLSTNALTGLSNQASGLADGLMSKLGSQAGGLTSLLSSGLPSGAASQLQNALGSVASAGSGIKVPSIALNTTDRSSISAAVSSQLGDPDIPAPRFGEVDEAAKGKVEDFESQKLEFILETGRIVSERNRAEAKVAQELDKYLNAQNNLPPGDSQISSAKANYDSALAEVQKLSDELTKLDEKFPAIALAIYGNSTTNTNVNSNSNTTATSIQRQVIKGTG
jgi:hypothetical protein